MATEHPVSGPCAVQIGVAGGSPVTLGYATNDDMVRVALTDFAEEVTSSDSGDEVVAVIERGRMATISGTLNHFDPDVWDYFEKMYLDSATIGTRQPIGTERFSASTIRTFQVGITPVLAGKDAWTFPICYVPPGDSITRGPFGATVNLASFVFRATPNQSTGVLYTKSTTS
jgi:hypothetical protein